MPSGALLQSPGTHVTAAVVKTYAKATGHIVLHSTLIKHTQNSNNYRIGLIYRNTVSNLDHMLAC